jgi:antitoxin PrlF
MPTATLTSKGQITLPRRVREHLRVGVGDTMDFVISADGEVRVRSGGMEVSALKGLLRRHGRRAVTLDQMDEAIRRGCRARR